MTRVLRWFEREFVVFSCVSMGNKCAPISLSAGPATPGTGGPMWDTARWAQRSDGYLIATPSTKDLTQNKKEETSTIRNCYAGAWADKYSSRRVTRTESKTKMNKHRSDTNRRHNNSCPYSSTLPLYSKFDNTTNNNNRYVTNSLVFYSSDCYHRYSSSSLNYFSFSLLFSLIVWREGHKLSKQINKNQFFFCFLEFQQWIG